MRRKPSHFVLLFILPLFVCAQQNKEVLFSVNENPVHTADFKHMYLKNADLIEEESQIDIEAYLELYIDYALKVAEAKALHLDEDPSFQHEYQKYRDQLVSKYLTDTKVTEALIKEAYERMKTAVNASHILIQVSPNASPADTLKAYNHTMEIREKILAGNSFEEMAKQYSEDPSAKKNGGNLGWFTVLKMVYPFETAAYETKIGEISMPVRTNFGYHLIKVIDKRAAKGEVSVAHIMLTEHVADSTFSPKKQIFEIYAKLEAGASFADLAKQYSEDRNSAFRGGKIRAFAPGEMNAKIFEKVAFSLKEPQDISRPFQSRFGWHIIQLLKKHPIGSLEEERSELVSNIKNDSRSRLINTAIIQELRKKYDIEINKKGLPYFQRYLEESIMAGTWKMDSSEIPSKTLININQEEKTYLDFAKYLSAQQKNTKGSKNKNTWIEMWFKDFTDNFILEYHKKHLEETNPEFAAIASEYYNGLLLFDLMEQKIWNTAKNDSLALQHYFEAHHEKYGSKTLEEIRGTVVSDYQEQLEKTWMKALHEKYKIKINHKNVEKLKASFE